MPREPVCQLFPHDEINGGCRHAPCCKWAFQMHVGSLKLQHPHIPLVPRGGNKWMPPPGGLCEDSRWHLFFPYWQVLYRWSRQSSTSVIETNRTSVELSLPFDEDYIIEIKPFSDGGDGSSSEQIRIPKISSKNASLSFFFPPFSLSALLLKPPSEPELRWN